MNQHIAHIKNLIDKIEGISEEEKMIIVKSLNAANKELELTAFKLERTNKVKHTTAILLEETIAELELKRKAVEAQNRELEVEKQRSEAALRELKATQSQLIHAEKMASLGELTAGIAHEIQNPLNFVNNFSELSNELVKEMENELNMDNKEVVMIIASDLKLNLEKIHHHGKRADAIVKGMLQHSRSNSGHKEPTDINALTDEYVRLVYHGLRAKDNAFNTAIKTDYDPDIAKVNIIPQDIGRVILNIVNNAFYAVSEKKKQSENYQPTIYISTRQLNGKIILSVKDNGIGIPDKIKDKIFQPFFTTKPTGQGTGLGLSLSYDIITKGHGGDLRLDSVEGEGSVFTIQLPYN